MVQKVGKAFKKTPTESQFFEKGTLTPLEFELAGDQLISASPIWEWESAIKKSLISKELSEDKQFLSATIYSNERLKDLVGDITDLQSESVDDNGFVKLKSAFDGIQGKKYFNNPFVQNDFLLTF
jgi:hypothetical protein